MKRETQADDAIPATSRRRIVQIGTHGMGWFAQLVIGITLAGFAIALLLPVIAGEIGPFSLQGAGYVAVATVLLTALGISVAPALVRNVLRWAHRRRSRGGSWEDDHPWQVGPQLRSPVARAVRPLLQGAGFLPMLFMFLPGSRIWTVPILNTALGLIAAVGVGWIAYRTHGLLWSGTLRVQYHPFPVAPGERLVVTFGTSRGATQLTHLVLRLRCLTNAKNATGFGLAETRLQWQESVTIDEPDALPAPGSDIEVEFALPGNRLGSHLATKYPVCWELSVRGKTGEASYEEVFLVPVYAVAPSTDA